MGPWNNVYAADERGVPHDGGFCRCGCRINNRALGKIGHSISNISVVLIIHRATDGHRAAGVFIVPIADADAVGSICTLGGRHAGHAVGDGDGAAISDMTATDTGSMITTGSLDDASLNIDVATAEMSLPPPLMVSVYPSYTKTPGYSL